MAFKFVKKEGGIESEEKYPYKDYDADYDDPNR